MSNKNHDTQIKTNKPIQKSENSNQRIENLDVLSKETYLGKVFELNRNLINLADNKANIIIRTIAFLLPFIFGINIYANFGVNGPSVTILMNTYVIATVCLLVSFFFSLSVIYARKEKTVLNTQPASSNLPDKKLCDMMFWNNITSVSAEVYFTYLRSNLDYEQMFEDYCAEIYSLAKINKQKFKLYNISLIFLSIGTFTLILGYIISSLILL